MLVGPLNFDSLLSKFLFVHAPGDFQSFGVIADRNVFVMTGPTFFGHFADRDGAIAPGGVHVQVAAITPRPARIGFKNRGGLRHREEVLANRRW